MSEGGQQPRDAWWVRPGEAPDDPWAAPPAAASTPPAAGAATAPLPVPPAPPADQPAYVAPDASGQAYAPQHTPPQHAQEQHTQPLPHYGAPQPAPAGDPNRRPTDPPFSSPYAPPYAHAAPTSGWNPQPPFAPLPPGAAARDKRSRPGLWIALGLLVALLAGVVGGATGWALSTDDAPKKASVLDGKADLGKVAKGTTTRPDGTVAAVAAVMLKRVVAIQVADGSGSGFVIRADGYIVTNNHVVASAAAGGTVQVEFADGHKEPARIVGRDGSYDLAVIKVEAQNLPTATFGDSDALVIGDPVIAIGEPLGLTGTVTTGIVSALNRPVVAGPEGDDTAYYSAIQTDAAINPGNSGGPLLNAKGEVIGVNSAISSLSGGSESAQAGSIGLGFAIPSVTAKRIAEEIIRTGKAVHPVIQVTPDADYAGEGARIAQSTKDGSPGVQPGGPADKAGLQPGDVVTKVDGAVIRNYNDLIVAIRAHAVGATITMTYTRGAEERTARVTLVAGQN